jgi:hypothetical protein
MGKKLGPRIRIEWRARIEKKETKAYSYVPKTIADKLKLKEATAPSLTIKDVVKKNKKGRNYPVPGSQGVGIQSVTCDFGEKTAKGNPKYVSLQIPRGTSITDVIAQLASAGSKVQRIRYQGNKFWYNVPGAGAGG